jgi:sporulation protein YlmC with PRC-barrel domain
MTDLDLALGLLDHQLVDSEGCNCGNVDDLELEGKAGENLELVAILSGPDAWPARLRGPFGRFMAWLGGGGVTRIEWKDVERVASRVVLKRTATDLGLAEGERAARRVIEKIPGSG